MKHDENATPTKEQLIVLIDSARNVDDVKHIRAMLKRIGYSDDGLMFARLRERADGTVAVEPIKTRSR